MVPLLLLRHHSLRRLHHHIKPFSTTTTNTPSPPPPLHIPLSHPTYQIWSSNTSLGKTLVSTGLASSFLLSPPSKSKFLYLKPVQTGFPSDSDSHFLFSKLSSLSLLRNSPLFSSNSVLNSSLPAATSLFPARFRTKNPQPGIVDLDFHQETGDLNSCSELVCKTLFAWEEAVSPHLAAERENAVVEDSVVVEALGRCLREGLEEGERKGRMDVFCVVETAGGVASPGPSGTLQCDLYRYVIVMSIGLWFVAFQILGLFV